MKKLIYLLPILGLFLLASCETKDVYYETNATNQETSSNDITTKDETPIESNETTPSKSDENNNNDSNTSASNETTPSNDEPKEDEKTSTGNISNGGAAEDDGEEWHRI